MAAVATAPDMDMAAIMDIMPIGQQLESQSL
jgi:hypothetical protein